MQTGSNGFALAPKTASGNAILYINPHTTFISDLKYRSARRAECLWSCKGKFSYIKDLMVDGCTLTTNVDVADMRKKLLLNDKLFYEYNSELLPVIEKLITVKYLKRKINSENI
jgi:hypothetical protein